MDNRRRDRGNRSDHIDKARQATIIVTALPWEIQEEILLYAAYKHQIQFDDVFQLGRGPEYSSTSGKGIIRLSHICCTWRTIMLNMPEFWSIALPGNMVENTLTRY